MFLQKLAARAEKIPDHRLNIFWSGQAKKMPGWWISATAGPLPLRSKVTITRARLNLSKARRPASAESFATFSRWARVRSFASTRCASDRLLRRIRKARNAKAEIKNNRRLFTGVVSGIAHYGNCIGIPTIGGEIYFDESFEGNPLVNVFCLGVLRHDQLARGAAQWRWQSGLLCGRRNRPRWSGRSGLRFAGTDRRIARRSAGACRWAIRSRKSFCLKPAWSFSRTMPSPEFKTWEPPVRLARPAKRRAAADTGVEIDLAKVPKASPA